LIIPVFCVETAFYNRLLNEDKRGDRGDRNTREKRRELMDDPKERRGYSHLKEEVLDRRYVESSFWKRLWACETDC
jgi:hypothetical protein